MWPLWLCLGSIAMYVLVSFLEWLGKSARGESNPGCLYLLVLPLAIITLPLKLASDILKAERRKKGRRR